MELKRRTNSTREVKKTDTEPLTKVTSNKATEETEAEETKEATEVTEEEVTESSLER